MNTFTVLVVKDDQMPHGQWAAMCRRLHKEVGYFAIRCMFEGFSQPYAERLKACFVYEMGDHEDDLQSAKRIASVICKQYGHSVSLIWYIEVRA